MTRGTVRRGPLPQRLERGLFIAMCALIALLALVNAGFGGRDRLALVAVAAGATTVLWLITRRYRMARMPGWQDPDPRRRPPR